MKSFKKDTVGQHSPGERPEGPVTSAPAVLSKPLSGSSTSSLCVTLPEDPVQMEIIWTYGIPDKPDDYTFMESLFDFETPPDRDSPWEVF